MNHLAVFPPISAVSDRLHAAGETVPGVFEVLLRRSSLFADIADYPEPAGNAWMKEKDKGIAGNTVFKAGTRELLPAEKYHRFWWLLFNDQNRGKENMRVEDEEGGEEDPQRVWISAGMKKDEWRKYDRDGVISRHPRKMCPDGVVVMGMIEPREYSEVVGKMMERMMMRTDQLPPNVDVLGVRRVFVDVNDLVVRLENTSDRDAIVNMCSFFPNRTVKVGMDNSREL